jgi:hypothetical protein
MGHQPYYGKTGGLTGNRWRIECLPHFGDLYVLVRSRPPKCRRHWLTAAGLPIFRGHWAHLPLGNMSSRGFISVEYGSPRYQMNWCGARCWVTSTPPDPVTQPSSRDRFSQHHGGWKTWEPPRVRFFIWWACQDRCWTGDRMARRGLPHPPRCPLCYNDGTYPDWVPLI